MKMTANRTSSGSNRAPGPHNSAARDAGATDPSRATESFADDAQRWRAVVARDQAADGHFYYSVKTTGVYCRPTCAARLPRRENVCFFPSWEEAERAGFRACKRCHPKARTILDGHARVVCDACRLIESAETVPDLATLAERAGMSRFHFQRIFKAALGVTPKAYSQGVHANRVRAALSKRSTVTEAFYEAGYSSSSRFYDTSSEVLGMRPTTFRRGGAGLTIRFVVGECSLGSVLVAASDRGICAIALGDDAQQLVRELQEQFANARLIGADRDFERTVAQIIAFVENPRGRLDLPLDIRGTAFQRRVWEALRQIPPGTTLSYSELARELKIPHATRAVASACAANRIAVAIPCHRVRRTDGGLAGYRWGVERKRALLRKESS